MADRYFALPPKAGCTLRRFAILGRDGKTVLRIQGSRPDGEEVPPPAAPVFRFDPTPVRTEGYSWL